MIRPYGVLPQPVAPCAATREERTAAQRAGEDAPAEMVFPGNPLRVRFAAPAKRLLRWVHAEGIGHHWAAGYGRVAAEWRAWAALAGPGLRWVEWPRKEDA